MNFNPIDQHNTLTRFLLADGTIKGAYLSGTSLVQAMQSAHQLDPVQTHILGQAYLAAGLLSSTLKGNEDRLMLQVNCSGPIQGFAVETNSRGEVRGSLKSETIDYSKISEDGDYTALYEQGLISITRDLEGSKNPYSGQTILVKGALAEDLAYYFLTSDQIPTAFHLSVENNTEGEVKGAGGLFLQALPGASESVLDEITGALPRMMPPWKAAAEKKEPAEYLRKILGKWDIEFLTTQPVHFFCPCSKELFANYLKGLDVKELIDLYRTGPHPVQIKCHSCGSLYAFSEKEIKKLLDEVLIEN